MQLLTTLISLAFAKTTIINVYPNCTIINNVTYEKELLLDNLKAPYHLTIDYDMNTLFFSYNGNGTVLGNKVNIFELAYFHLDNKRLVHLNNVVGGFASAVDQKHKEVYLGGDDGIYMFDWINNSAVNLDIINASIWQMFYNDGLYFTTYPNGEAFWYRGRYLAGLANRTKVKLIAIEQNGRVVFCNSSGLYGYNAAGIKITKLGNYALIGFSADIHNKLYFATSDAIYYIGGKKIVIKRIVQIADIYGLAIERNGNFIYSTEDSIIRLKPTHNNCTNITVSVKKTTTKQSWISTKHKANATSKL